MKHKAEIVIDADRATVWQLFDERGRIRNWRSSLKSFTHLSGIAGHPDAISEFICDENGRDVRMTETITARRDRSFLGGTYESTWGTVVVFNLFEDEGREKTRWSVNTNFIFKGFMKVMALFKRKSYLHRIEADMNRFKLLVESEVAGESS